MRLHPYMTVRILRQVDGLEQIAELAGNHHESVDGSGDPRGLSDAALPMTDWVLAAAVSYQSALDRGPTVSRSPEMPRPDGSATGSSGVSSTRPPSRRSCRRRATLRRDRTSAQAGSASRDRGALPGGPGSVEQGDRENPGDQREDRAQPRRADYAKIGASNRIGASMYALKHGLVILSPADRHYTGGELPGTAVPGWVHTDEWAPTEGRGGLPS